MCNRQVDFLYTELGSEGIEDRIRIGIHNAIKHSQFFEKN